ncbi:hypothetical protein EII17_08265 [Clostridiales bacterium COT073_COT-073]|nr:hypothetical protein EII17_08265 [Clostridiales bacterium COT073_COT-073]
MKQNKSKHQKTLKLLLLAHSLLVGLTALVFFGLSFFFWSDLRLSALGTVIGGAGGLILIYSMSWSIERAIEYDPQAAQKYMLKHYFIRTLLTMALLLLGIFTDKWMLLGIAAGLLCVKGGGFLAPELEKGILKDRNID